MKFTGIILLALFASLQAQAQIQVQNEAEAPKAITILVKNKLLQVPAIQTQLLNPAQATTITTKKDESVVVILKPAAPTVDLVELLKENNLAIDLQKPNQKYPGLPLPGMPKPKDTPKEGQPKNPKDPKGCKDCEGGGAGGGGGGIDGEIIDPKHKPF